MLAPSITPRPSKTALLTNGAGTSPLSAARRLQTPSPRRPSGSPIVSANVNAMVSPIKKSSFPVNRFKADDDVRGAQPVGDSSGDNPDSTASAVAATTTTSSSDAAVGVLGAALAPSVCEASESSGGADVGTSGDPLFCSPRKKVLRKKPVILDGDIRNLETGFVIGKDRSFVGEHDAFESNRSIDQVTHVMQNLGIRVTRDEAKVLLHEYEETNGGSEISYQQFVQELAQFQPSANSVGSANRALGQLSGSSSSNSTDSGLFGPNNKRLAMKKNRLVAHMAKLTKIHSHWLEEMELFLKKHLRMPWSHVREAFASYEAAHRTIGFGSHSISKHVFREILTTKLQLNVPEPLLNGVFQIFRTENDFAICSPRRHKSDRQHQHHEDDELGHDLERMNYAEFLTHFGNLFHQNELVSVGNTLQHEVNQTSQFKNEEAGGKGSGSGAGSPLSPSNTFLSNGVAIALGSPMKKRLVRHAAKSTININPHGPGPHEDYSFAGSIYGHLFEDGNTPIPDNLRLRLPHDNVFMERLRVLLTDKITERFSDVKKAFMALDKDSNGLISMNEFTQVLRNFNIFLTKEETELFMDFFDRNHDHFIDYHEFFAKFGDVMKPSAVRNVENSSLLLTSDRDRDCVKAPESELKESLSALSDGAWRAIYVELQISDPKDTGFVTTAELLRVLGKYLGQVPTKHYQALFRACGSITHHMMNYRNLIKSYRDVVLDNDRWNKPNIMKETETKYRKSPVDSHLMVWSIRALRAKMTTSEWKQMKNAILSSDIGHKVGRIPSKVFAEQVKRGMKLSDDQVAFLCYFYEDKSIATDKLLIKYGSFLNDFEETGFEELEEDSPTSTPSQAKREVNGSLAMSSTTGIVQDQQQQLQQQQDLWMDLVRTKGEALARLFQQFDPEQKGFVGDKHWEEILFKQFGDKLNKPPRKDDGFWRKYFAQGDRFLYRAFLLDCNPKATFSTHAIANPAAINASISLTSGDAGDQAGAIDQGEALGVNSLLDVHEAREALRYHMTCSNKSQRHVYKLFRAVDASKNGVLSFPEIQRVLERLGIIMTEDTCQELLSQFAVDDECAASGNDTVELFATGDVHGHANAKGSYNYLMLLFAFGGRDPDKLDGMSDLSSNCSYYSAINISPRRLVRIHDDALPQSLVARNLAAATAVENAIQRPRPGGVAASSGSSGTANEIEAKIRSQLAQEVSQKKNNRWKELARAFQQVDSERRGHVSVTTCKKVLEDHGIPLTMEQVTRLGAKYDLHQNGRVAYFEMLKNLMSFMSEKQTKISASSNLPFLGLGNGNSGGGSGAAVAESGTGAGIGAATLVPQTTRAQVKDKWREIYSSFRALDKTNCGRLSGAHVRQLLAWYTISLSDSEFLNLLREFDHPQDGLLDYNRFMKACLT